MNMAPSPNTPPSIATAWSPTTGRGGNAQVLRSFTTNCTLCIAGLQLQRLHPCSDSICQRCALRRRHKRATPSHDEHLCA